MLKVVEAFAGIGSQAKALSQLNKEKGIKYEISNIIEWELSAILAYDLIHNGDSILPQFKNMEREDLIKGINKYPLSIDGSSLANPKYIMRFDDDSLKKFLTAIVRTKNLVSITDVTAEDLEENIDIFTYSFPCQDLSLSGYFHGDTGGISRNARNSSSMLWQVERILMEFKKINKPMPKALIMENVTAINSTKHRDNFNEWKNSLEKLGYSNVSFNLQSIDFGIPQSRKRTFMISVYHDNDNKIKKHIEEMFAESVLINTGRSAQKIIKTKLKDILKLNYNNEVYRNEAIQYIPNYTRSRKEIEQKNTVIYNGINIKAKHVNTLTTRQDRHPNSGYIRVDKEELGLSDEKAPFRYLTAREAFLLMGFDERDYDSIVKNNFNSGKSNQFFSKHRLTKLAGNSIVVNVIKAVLEETITILNSLDKKY